MSTRIQNVVEKLYNGNLYRSTLEAKTAQTLDELGIPFQYEPRKIVLQEGFRSPFQKDKVRALTYMPDFEIGSIMLECKGFETPEWKIKKKLLFKWLLENEPDTIFYQTHDSGRDILKALDNHWSYLGYYIEVTSKESKRKPPVTKKFESIHEAMVELGLDGKPLGPILSGLTGRKEYVYHYNWKLKRITL